jgi:hypothetical protein
LRRPHIRAARADADPRPILAAALLLAVVLASGAGCIFDPPTKPPGGKVVKEPTPYPRPYTPENAILYLKAAWENRDSTRADSIYADNYRGTSSESGVQLPPFTKTDEVRAVGGVQIDPDVNGVSLNFGSPSTWRRQVYSNDPPNWVAYSIQSPDIRVYTTTDELVANKSTSFEFKLQSYAVAPGDTLWQIIGWTETQ